MIRLYFSDLINASSVSNFIQSFQNAIQSGNGEDDEVQIYISSGGGEVDVAIELYRFLKDSGFKIHTINTSVVNSAAIIIYLAGIKRKCYPESTFYIHCISKKLNGEYNADSLQIELKELEINTDIVSLILEKNTTKSARYWKKIMKKGKILSAKESINLGISNYIDNGNKC